MKVRCYDNSYLEDCLTVGRIYDVKEIKENYYVIKDDKGITNLFWHGEFEIVKENEMEKTFREVIADIKEGEVWESEEKIISLMNTNDVVITLKDRDRRINSMGFASSTLYHLQRKQYTFEEAFKAYEDGKEIESCYSGDKYMIQHGGSDCYADGSKTGTIGFNEIRGKWYINN